MAKAKITVSLSPELLKRIDRRAGGNRSAYVEELLRDAIIAQAWEGFARDLAEDEASEMRAMADASEEATGAMLAADDG